MKVRRRRWTYTFSAWLAEDRWSNADREHENRCRLYARPCPHGKIWEWNANRGSRNLLRVLHGPGYLRVLVGPRYWRLLSVG